MTDHMPTPKVSRLEVSRRALDVLDIGRKAADRHRELWRATFGVGDGAT